MNDIFLRGVIKDIQYSHTTNNIAYDKAHLVVKNSNIDYSIVDLVFKEYINDYHDGDEIDLVGNLRTYSDWSEKENKYKTHVYVYTFLNSLKDEEKEREPFKSQDNILQFDGVIGQMGELRKFKNDKINIQILVKNKLSSGPRAVINYIPCIAWGKIATAAANYKVGEEVVVTGELRSHEYKKMLDDGTYEIRVAHEALITNICRKEEVE